MTGYDLWYLIGGLLGLLCIASYAFTENQNGLSRFNFLLGIIILFVVYIRYMS